MDSRLQEMLDHFEITRMLAEYCGSCDRCDEDRLAGVYHKDSWDDHGHIRASGSEFVKLILEDIRSTTTSLFHQLGQSLVKVDGDSAGAETYFIAAADTDEPAGRKVNLLGGRFIDSLTREEGRWLIKQRTVVRDWTIAMPLEQEWLSATSLPLGQRSNEDPSFAALGLIHSAARVAAGKL